MATYKGIQGYTVQKLATDPTASEAVGQLWYNSTNGKFNISTEGAGAWASGGSLNTARGKAGNMGIQTAAIWVGGSDSPTDLSETYDGTSWTEGNNLNTSRIYNAGTGTTTAGLTMGGRTPGPTPTRVSTTSEEYDGTSWAEGGDIPSKRESGSAAGIQTAALYMGGSPPSPPGVNITLTYDGTSWAVSPATLTTARYQAAAIGISTAALYTGGTPAHAVNESFNGSAWTEVGDIPAASAGSAMSGTQTAALFFGGGPPADGTQNYSWDGSSWTTNTSLTTGRINLGGTPSGTSSLALAYGGGDGPQFDQTEEWSEPVYTIKTVTVS